MAIKNVTYKEPASYFTPTMLKAAEEWDRQHKKISFVMGDITKIEADAIVNAANESLLGGGGVDGAIHRAAGSKLLEECRTLHGCKTGEAKITKGYNLPADFVIHTVGPIYYENLESAPELLASCYRNSLDVAKNNDIHTIAFPGISTGVYGYPMNEAAKVAISEVKRWIDNNKEYEMKVIFVSFTDSADEIMRKTAESLEM